MGTLTLEQGFSLGQTVVYCQGHLSPHMVCVSPTDVHDGVWTVKNWRVSGLGYTGTSGWLSTGYGY